MRARTTSIGAVLLLLAGTIASTDAAAAPGYVVIVHPEVSASSLDMRLLAEIFLKRTTRWADGEPIDPVDLAPDSMVRRRFSADVLRRSVPAIKSYWNQLIFSGRDVPPTEFATEEAVVEYVRSHPGAIAYVGPKVELSGVRVIRVD